MTKVELVVAVGQVLLAGGLVYHGWSETNIYPFLLGIYLFIDVRLHMMRKW